MRLNLRLRGKLLRKQVKAELNIEKTYLGHAK
jgi:hypothetical protein